MNSAENIEYHQNSGKYDLKRPQLALKESCTGCGACMAVCPVCAISMEPDEETGFFYPYLNVESCIHCEKCEKICPENPSVLSENNQGYSEVYAVNNVKMEVRLRSASGGAFSALATTMLKSGGSVAGVALLKNNTCKHIIIDSEYELGILEGTKYFQSDTSEIYEEVLDRVNTKNKDVMFCGTPCQVCAMKNFVKEKGIEERLILIDMLCRGVPSPYVYKSYINLLEKEYEKKVYQIQMKEKTRGWDRIGTMVTFEDGSTQYIAKEESMFLKSFIETNLSIRESCFHCKYKTIYREGDITIADFWGLRNNRMLDNKGTSLMILSTEKGKTFFEQVKPFVDYIPSTMWRVYRGNRAAFQKVFCDSLKRKQFYRLLHMGKNLREAVNEALCNEL